MPQPLPPAAWRAIRWVVVVGTLLLAALAFLLPGVGLELFWGVYVPLMPLLFLIAPGIWRNICPLASFNQIPRTLGFTRGLTIPSGLQAYTPLISMGLLFLIVPMRKVVIDQS